MIDLLHKRLVFVYFSLLINCVLNLSSGIGYSSYYRLVDSRLVN